MTNVSVPWLPTQTRGSRMHSTVCFNFSRLHLYEAKMVGNRDEWWRIMRVNTQRRPRHQISVGLKSFLPSQSSAKDILIETEQCWQSGSGGQDPFPPIADGT